MLAKRRGAIRFPGQDILEDEPHRSTAARPGLRARGIAAFTDLTVFEYGGRRCAAAPLTGRQRRTVDRRSGCSFQSGEMPNRLRRAA
jgi:hypothetical protein